MQKITPFLCSPERPKKHGVMQAILQMDKIDINALKQAAENQ
jgi:predicted 3-demethylubiquinone-9 3-methyltransferase (glyoxalase superfamily)